MSENQPKPVLHDLQFNVAQLLKEATGATRSYEVNSEAAEKKLDDEIKIVSPLVGQVRFLRTGSDILVTGRLDTTVQKSCGRCLTVFTTPVSIELEEEFYPTIDVSTGAVLPQDSEADEATRIDERHILDLWEVVRQEVLLTSDDIRYCRPGCKGLCPYCGQDRNVAPCDCEENLIDPRWAGLQALEIED
jgi:uncharacterized protein